LLGRLCNYFSPEELGLVLSGHFYGEAGSALVAIANERGGDDNITSVIVYVANALRRASSPTGFGFVRRSGFTTLSIENAERAEASRRGAQPPDVL